MTERTTLMGQAKPNGVRVRYGLPKAETIQEWFQRGGLNLSTFRGAKNVVPVPTGEAEVELQTPYLADNIIHPRKVDGRVPVGSRVGVFEELLALAQELITRPVVAFGTELLDADGNKFFPARFPDWDKPTVGFVREGEFMGDPQILITPL